MNPEELHEWWKKVKDIPIYGRYEPKEAKSFFTMPEYFDDAGILTWEAIPAAEAYGFGSIGVGTVHRDTVWPSLTALLPQITEDFTGKKLDDLLEKSNYQITRRAGIMQLAKRKIDVKRKFRLLLSMKKMLLTNFVAFFYQMMAMLASLKEQNALFMLPVK